MSNELIPTHDELKTIEAIAKYASDSKFFNSLGGVGGILTIMLYGKDLGLTPMQAIMGIDIIQGKPSLKPQLMNAKIRAAGHKLEIDNDDKRCVITGTRKDTGETATASFSVDDAKKAGIFKSGGGWDKYPGDMCFARCLSRLARRLFPDVIGMSYVEGELDDPNAEKKGAVIDVSKCEKVQPKEIKEKLTRAQIDELERECGGEPYFGEWKKLACSHLKVNKIEDANATDFSRMQNHAFRWKHTKHASFGEPVKSDMTQVQEIEVEHSVVVEKVDTEEESPF